MTSRMAALKAFHANADAVALVEVVSTMGSTPREAGAFMLVSKHASCGTIGGGQLEFIATAKARRMLQDRGEGLELDVPLGPEIGQCCGGRVAVAIKPLDNALLSTLIARIEAEEALRPDIYLFGGGHVGQALASALSLLPVRVIVIETRAEALEGMPEAVETRLTAMPEDDARSARPGAAFVVLTHDHALDFLIVAEALKREDACYVGMIGSKTKKATFRSWFLRTAGGTSAHYARLVSPIGGARVADKRPAVIAALAAAEIVTALADHAARTVAQTAPRSAISAS